jgi:hypothetical protein
MSLRNCKESGKYSLVFFLKSPRMSSAPASQNTALGMAIGGAVIASIGAVSMYAVEKKKPTVKSLIRDFIIGGVMVLLLLQLLPDSAQHLIDTVKSIPSFSSSMMGGSSGLGDMDIQVGIPRF